MKTRMYWFVACFLLLIVPRLEPALAATPAPLLAIQMVQFGPQGQFIVNGQPFIPIMSWAQDPSNFALLRSLNFNTFMGNNVSPLQQAQAAAAAGGYCVVGSSSTSQVIAARSNPFILGWEQDDEPDNPQAASSGGYTPRETPAQTASSYQFLENLNIKRPVFTTLTSEFMNQFQNYTAQQKATLYPGYLSSTDVAGFDIYPIYGWGRPNWLNYPASGVSQLVNMAGGKPVYAWIETSKGSQWITYNLQPDVLPADTRFEVWGALIEGATAIGYFTHAWQPSFTEFAPTPAMQDELRRLNGQITELTPEILAPPAARHVTMSMVTPDTRLPLSCHFKATEYGDQLWIFAQDTDLGSNASQLGQFDPISPRAGHATIYVDGLTAGTIIERLDVDDLGYTPIVAENGYFEDDFDALGEGIYMIVPEPASAALLALAVLMLPRRRRARG